MLVSSSFVIYFAERFLHRDNLWGFRIFWLLTMAMGSYFLYGQAVEWMGPTFWLYDGRVWWRVLLAYWLSWPARIHGRVATGHYAGPIFYS